ncbi:MAG: IS200/IS605 family transposase [Bacteroidota bacterium]
MANTYSQVLIHIVFAVKYRRALIQEAWREKLEKYMTGIVQNSGQKLLAIYCMPDHCHILVGMKPNIAISDLVKEIKEHSTKWINVQKFCPHKFYWQNGFGVFSYSQSQLPAIGHYIENQPYHHQKKRFQKEYAEMLTKFEVDYQDQFVFSDPE